MLDRSPETPRLLPAQTHSKSLSPVAPPYQFGPYATPLLPADTKALFNQLLRILRRQSWKLALFVIAAMAVALVLQFTFPHLYSATALLRLDRHSAPGAVGQEASQISTINDMDVLIDTDIELAQSDPVVRPVAERYHLVANDKPHFSWLKLFTPKPDAEAIRETKAAPIKLTGLEVTRPANTYLIRITYRAWKSPELAANVANGIAESLVKNVHEAQDRSYDDLSDAMRRDMDQLRSKMDDSSKKLAEYEHELNMVDPEQRSTVLTSRLTQLLAEYTSAQSDRLHKQAELDGITKSPTLAATQATEADRQRQSLLDEALEHVASARQQFVAARSYYGENHPEYRKAKQELDDAEAQAEKMRVATGDKARAEYQQALGRELLLKRQFDKAKTEVDGLTARALAYSQLKSEAENDRRMYMDLEVHMRDADVNRQFRDATVQFASPALPPANAIFPKLKVNLPIAFVLALALGVLGAIAADALNNTFSDAEELSSRMGLEVMASLPDGLPLKRKRDIQTRALPAVPRYSAATVIPYEQAMRMLRNAVARAGIGESIRTLLITSGAAGEGRSTTAAHLAEACTERGKTVLLIDADLRHPTLHEKFQITDRSGLADVLAHRISAVDAIAASDVPGLFVMPAGAYLPNGADLISSGFERLLNKVRSTFDVVMIDAGPLLEISETEELAATVDGVLVIAKAGATSTTELAGTLTTLSRSRANVVGVVMNQVKFLHHTRSAGLGTNVAKVFSR